LDTSLTAFAQLSALKLNCQRSFISLIDHETQYIIAEATRTVSLETGETDAGTDDAIYLGATTLGIFWGVCPNTISVFTATDNSLNITAPYVKANQSYYVMNDLSKVTGYETRPYIIGWPHMRYYAEVPIHSPSGPVIGSLCVVNNKPREVLDTKGISALKEISHAVMDHLELVMSKVQRERAERMIHGLGLFVKGSDSLREWWMNSEKNSRTVDPSRRRLTINEQAD
jgi:GAF domain-containing protein